MTDEPRMKNLPMLDSDRETFRAEFEGFDEMTLEELRAAVRARQDDLLDLILALRGPA